jgi:hypothetical protein
VSAAMGEVDLPRGKLEGALLWAAAIAAHGIETKVQRVGRDASQVVTSGGAVRLVSLYFLYGPPLLEGGDERIFNYKLAEAVKLGSKGLTSAGRG